MNETTETMQNKQTGNHLLVVSEGPHIRSNDSVPRMMLITLAALVPTLVVSIILSGMRVAFTIALSIVAAAGTELVFKCAGKKRFVMIDGSAALTGLLLAFSLPPQAPFWMAPIGSIFAIIMVKIVFGGTGYNFLNPALAGRAFLVISFPMAFGVMPLPGISVTGADVLTRFIGCAGGWIGGGSAGALLIGAIALGCMRIIDFMVPLAYISTAFVLYWVSGGTENLFTATTLLSAALQVCSGGLVLAALFMATDPVTSPTTAAARLLFGAGCGVATFLFSKAGNANDGAMWALLLMNLSVPYLDRYCRRTPFGMRPMVKKRSPDVAGRANSTAAEG
jgi:Na+-translocating ferredoxin:NAD+ oxidoreductase subunit D